jgi:hypothetical protein
MCMLFAEAGMVDLRFLHRAISRCHIVLCDVKKRDPASRQDLLNINYNMNTYFTIISLPV